MPINYQHLMQLSIDGLKSSFTDRDTILYALGLGMGRDPLDEEELAYVLETRQLKAMPTMATILGRPPLIKQTGADYTRAVHGDQYLRLHQPLAAADDIVSDSRVVAAYDKGPGRGALIYIENELRKASDNTLIATHTSGVFARGDGGFGGPSGSGWTPHKIPARQPDHGVELCTRADQALLYRLNGDLNPLHADPVMAKKAGFPVPILHGLCTFGIACRAILASVCDYDQTRITEFNARFSAPVYPGETVTTNIWVDGKTVSFRCRLKERDVVVLDHGKCTLA